MSQTTVTNKLVSDAGLPLGKIVVNVILLSSTGAQLTAAFDGTEEITPYATTHTDVEGVWTLNLFPNSEITPAGTQYEVTHLVSTGSQTVKFVVPAGGATPVVHHLSELVV